MHGIITPEMARAELERRQQASVPEPAPSAAPAGITAEMAKAELARRQGANPAPMGQAPKQNAFMSGVDAFNAGAERIAHGALQPLLEGPLGERVKRGSQQYHQEQQALLKQAQLDNPAAAGIGEFAGGIAGASPLYAIPGLGTGKITKALTQGALQGGLAGGLQYTGQDDSRLLNAGLGAGLGAASYPLARGLSAANPYVKAGTGSLAGAGLAYGLGDGSAKEGAIGAGLGAAAPFIPGALVSGGKKLINAGANKLSGGLATPLSERGPLQDIVARDMLNKVDPQEALKRKAAAERLGLSYITPAEASGSPVAGAAQGALSRTKEGSQALYNAGQERLGTEKKSIDNLMDLISKDDRPGAFQVRDAAQKRIAAEEKALRDKASPFYQAAEAKNPVVNVSDIIKKINADLPTAKGEIKTTLQKALEYITPAQKEKIIPGSKLVDAEGKPFIEESIKPAETRLNEMHNAKIAMDALIEGRGEQAISRTSKRKLIEIQKSLLGAMDNASTEYKTAREIFSKGSKPLEQLRNSELAKKVADMDDVQVKNISKNIFDPAQTDTAVLRQLRDKISSVDRGAWNKIFRNEMERVMDKRDISGSTFYKQNLQSDRRFNQLMEAADGIPGAQEKLRDMRLVFKDLINPNNARGAAGLAKNSMDKNRNAPEAVYEHIKNAAGGKYDKAAVKLITSKEWDKEFEAIAKINNKENRAIRMSDLLAKIATVGTTGMMTSSDSKQK